MGKVGNINIKGHSTKNKKRSGKNRSRTENHEVAVKCLSIRAFSFAFDSVLVAKADITKIIEQRDAETEGKHAYHPTQHTEYEERKRPSLNNLMDHKKLQSHTAKRNQQHGNDQQCPDDKKHQDGKHTLHKPVLHGHSLVSQIVGINITETIENSHDATGTKNQAQENTH